MLEGNIKPFILGAAVGVMGAAAIRYLGKTHPGYSYETVPNIPKYLKIADRIGEPFMQLKKIYAHHWHWEDVVFDSQFKGFGVFLEGAPIGNPQNNPLFGVIAHLGGRPLGYLMDINREDPRTQGVKDFFVGFNWEGAEHMRRCKLKLSQPFFMMAGPDNGCIIYAMDRYGNPLPLNQLSDLMDRKDMPPGIRTL